LQHLPEAADANRAVTTSAANLVVLAMTIYVLDDFKVVYYSTEEGWGRIGLTVPEE